jgi:peptidoglycan/xylan/chitin deacetylase (PgdA/CDA1 family)
MSMDADGFRLRGTYPLGPAESLKARGRRGAKALAEALLPTSLVAWREPGTRRGQGGSGRVALTFDDGPTPLTRDYLAVLARYGVRATFFLVGELCARHPELVLAIQRAGHELGGHGYTHQRFTNLTPKALMDELERTRTLLPSEPNRRPIVRPPHGAVSLTSTVTSASAGYTTVLWSYDSNDWATHQASEVARTFHEQTVDPGDIVLFHEGQTWTLDALPRVIEHLKKSGHELTTTGELLGR